MKRSKVTGGDGRFDIPPTQRTRCCHKFCDPGQESTKEDLPGGRSFSAHHMYACCVLIANNMANLILLTECVFLWALPSVHRFNLLGLLSFSERTVTYTQICVKARNVSCFDTHRIPHIRALTFTRIYFFNNPFSC